MQPAGPRAPLGSGVVLEALRLEGDPQGTHLPRVTELQTAEQDKGSSGKPSTRLETAARLPRRTPREEPARPCVSITLVFGCNGNHSRWIVRITVDPYLVWERREGSRVYPGRGF